MSDGLLVFLLFVIIFVLPVCALFSAVAYDCSVYGKTTGRYTEFTFGTCYVETEKGRLVPREEFNYRAYTNEK